MKTDSQISLNNLADLCGVSRATVLSWVEKGRIHPSEKHEDRFYFNLGKLQDIPEVWEMTHTDWDNELKIKPENDYTGIELFAGGGGLALGLEKAGIRHVLLNEVDHDACQTLKINRPYWNIIEEDIHNIDFTSFHGKVDIISGGFPCQAFSYAGKRLGFEETRGTLFFEMARAVKEISPKIILGENVKGLMEHDRGRTLKTISKVIDELGYFLVPPKILKATRYNVPQKRERLFLVAIRKDLIGNIDFKWPDVSPLYPTLKDAFYPGSLYETEVPLSKGAQYPPKKRRILDLVPQGGDWRDLPPEIAKEYLKGSYDLGGGKTGMARRLDLEEASLTLTCSPAQKQTERCHPLETRPLSIREYARVQTFPDTWNFCGGLSSQYKQIGNAVPVNLAWAMGRALIRLLNDIYKNNDLTENKEQGNYFPKFRYDGLFEGMVCEPEDTSIKNKKKK